MRACVCERGGGERERERDEGLELTMGPWHNRPVEQRTWRTTGQRVNGPGAQRAWGETGPGGSTDLGHNGPRGTTDLGLTPVPV